MGWRIEVVDEIIDEKRSFLFIPLEIEFMIIRRIKPIHVPILVAHPAVLFCKYTFSLKH